MEGFRIEKKPAKMELPPSAPKGDGDLDEHIDFILEHHDHELREKWEDLIKDLPPQKQIEKLENLALKRREATAVKPYLSDHLTVLDHLPENAEAFFSEAMKSFDEKSQEVNRGFNGKIMEYPGVGRDKPNVVYKMLIRSPIGKQNDLMSEASYLADLHDLSEKYTGSKVGVPRPLYCATMHDARIIAMEKIPGVSIDQILSQEIPLPPDFDVDALEKNLSDFVSYMNATGFYHNDLRVGNIMINLETHTAEEPSAYIIDTGNAKRVIGQGTREGEIDNTADRVMLQKVMQTLRNYKGRQKTGI